jgi:Flp pilus assembly protein TadG
MSNVTDLVILVPVLMLVLFLVIQLAMWGMAAQAVSAAAATGGQAARNYSGTSDAGRSAAQASVDGLGARMVRNATISVTDSGGDQVVEVSGTVVQIIPFLSITVTGRSVAPHQQYRASG